LGPGLVLPAVLQALPLVGEWSDSANTAGLLLNSGAERTTLNGLLHVIFLRPERPA
jgi:hypothetical protein